MPAAPATGVRQLGVALSPGDDYAASRTTEGHGVRIGLNAGVDDDALRAGLMTVLSLLSAGPLPAGLS